MDQDFGALVRLFNPQRVAAAATILILSLIISRLITSTLDRLGEGSPRYRLTLKKLSTFARFFVFIVASYLVLTNVLVLGPEAWLALGGTIAVTAGFALKDTAASIISGLLILVDRPFQVGDRVSFDKYYGEIKEIGLRTVRLQTLDDNLVSIPTNKFLTDSVASANAGELDMMVVVDFFIAIDADFERAKRIAYEAAVTSKYVYLEKPVVVHLSEELTSAGYATRLRVLSYVVDCRFERRLVTDLTERVKAAFRSDGIGPPFSQQRLELRRDLSEAPHAAATSA